MEGATDVIGGRLQLAGYQSPGTNTPSWQNVEGLIETLAILKDVENLELGDGVRGLEILADPMLPVVFNNLLEDSVRYASDRTSVKISAAKRGEELLLMYEDDGPGIPSEKKDSIFDHNYGPSHGIGLHLCRDILLESNISIVEVGTPEKGVRFEMLVPAGQFRTA